MLKLYTAYSEIKTAVEDGLTAAGFVDGLSLTNEEIVATINPMYWFLAVSNKDAADKETYVTYRIDAIDPSGHGDGQIMQRKATVTINLYSRSKNVDQLFSNLNDQFVETLQNFEMSSIDYNTSANMYVHSFRIEMMVHEA